MAVYAVQIGLIFFLCSVEGSLKDFWLSDAVWLSSLESSRWLSSVSRCLELANEAADNIIIGKTVVLKGATETRNLHLLRRIGFTF